MGCAYESARISSSNHLADRFSNELEGLPIAARGKRISALPVGVVVVRVPGVTSADLLEVLAPIWHLKASTDRAVRQRMRAVLEWAVAMELRPDNPSDRIGRVLGPQNDVVQHIRALLHREVASAIRDGTGCGCAAGPEAGLRVPGADGGAAERGTRAAWEEIDPREGVWAVPATCMKAKREHRVPLCGRAIDILDEARTFGDGTPIVFTIGDGQPIMEKHLRRLLAALEIAAVPHGFRSSFRDWAAE